MPRPKENLLDGDAQFLGVNELDPPGELGRGELARARNNRCRFGKAEPRLGYFKVPWSNIVTTGAASKPIPYGTVYGRGYFQDDDGMVWAIIAADGKVFKFRDGNGSSEVPMPPGILITSTVNFTQTYSGLVMFRGIGNATLLMASLDLGFVVATQANNTISGAGTENPTNGTADIPKADRGEWIYTRLYVPTETATEKDLLNISDFLNATRFAGVRSQARINQGASDRLTRALKFGTKHAAIAFKTASVYALYGTDFDLAEMRQDEITREFGLLSTRGCINTGKQPTKEDEKGRPDEVWFTGTSGAVYSITPDENGLLGCSALPVSRWMQKTFARINKRVGASTITYELWDDKLYIAMPLDDASAQGPELIRSQSYTAGSYIHFVIPGKTYFWTKGAAETQLVNGSETLVESAQFTAAAGTVTITGGVGAVTGSLKRVFTEVNNAVAVYDFVRGKWTGYDDAMTVFEWLKLPVDGEEKLFFIGADGFINYAEALFDDEVGYEIFVDPFALVFFPGNYPPSGVLSGALTAGRVYTYVLNATVTAIVNGTETLTAQSGTFTAQEPLIDFHGTPNGAFSVPTVRTVDYNLEYAAVDHEWLSRGYRAQTLGRKRFPWLTLNLRTFDPNYDLTCLLDGVNEEFALRSDVTRDNTKYFKPAGTPAWVPTNYNEDHANPHREDYHVELSDAISNGADIVAGQRYYVDSADAFTAASITYNAVVYARGTTFLGVAGQTTWSVTSGSPRVYPPGSYILPGEDGIVLDLHQEQEEAFRVNRRGREIQFRGRNSQGRVELVSLVLEAFEVDIRHQKLKG
jgi:hypothetical protein